MRIIKVYIRMVDRINEWVGLSVSVLLPAMVCCLAYEVIMRYFFRIAPVWTHDMAIFMFGYVGLLGGGYVHKHRAHINVDIVYARLSPRRQAMADVVAGLLIFFFLILVILTTWEPAISALANNESLSSNWAPPVGHFKLMIPVGAFLLFLQVLANWIRSLYHVLTGEGLVV